MESRMYLMKGLRIGKQWAIMVMRYVASPVFSCQMLELNVVFS